MKLKLDNVKVFSDCISIISEIVTEVRIKVTKEGIKIIAIDPANVALVMLTLPPTSFSVLEADEEDISINLNDLKSVLRRCNDSSSIIMEKKENNLEIDVQDKVKRKFVLSLIDIDSEDKNIPELEFKNQIELDSRLFSDAIEDASVVADSCSFLCTENKFVIEAKGNLNSARSEFSGDEAIFRKIEEGKAKYSLEYLQKFVKGARLGDKVLISYSKDYPLRIDFANPVAQLGFILAPRVESDD